MKKAYYLLIATVLTTLSACSSSDEPAITTDKKINLTTSIEKEAIVKSPVLDETGKGQFSNGDTFTLLVANSEGKYNNFDFTVGATELYWKNVNIANSGNVSFAACYPKQEVVDDKFTFDLSKTSDKDLLLAQTTGVATESENPVNLSFKHAMHNLKVVFTADSDIDADAILTKCTAKSSCEVNLLDGSLNTAGSATADFTEKGKEVNFLIVPQATADVTLEVTAGNASTTISIASLKPELTELKSGMQLRVELTVKNGKIEIGNITIEGWENQGTIGGEIIL